MGFLEGQLLIASPAMSDPNFARTVVAIANHDEDGALGIVLNRPSDTEVVDAVPAGSPSSTSYPTPPTSCSRTTRRRSRARYGSSSVAGRVTLRAAAPSKVPPPRRPAQGDL